MNEIASAILPVFFIAAAAYGLRRRYPLDTKTLSSINIYLLIPALVFSSLSRSEIQWGVFGRYAIGALLMLLAMTALLSFIARRRKLTGAAASAFMMTMFMNLGNFGLPVCKFAFGDKGLALAVVVMVCGSFLQNSVGIYFALRSRYSIAKAFFQVFYFPMVYAFALALLCQRTGYQLPNPLLRAVDFTGDAAIPIQLIILGIQLAETRLDKSANIFLATAMRLAGGPLLALLLVYLLGLEGLAAQVFIVQMSGPVAVGMAAYGVQFDVAPRFLASAVCWSFLLSLFSVSMVLLALAKISL